MRIPAAEPARTFVRKVRKTGTYEWRNYWRRQPIVPDTVLYESFSGNGMLCNPEAIFRGLLADPDFAHLKHIWVLDGLENYAAVRAEFAGNPRVRFVQIHSRQYYRALATSKYLVNNATFPADFSKRLGQVYLNTWHGTPLKAMGYDQPEGGPGTKNVIRNMVSADYLLSSGDYMTERMYEGAFRLRNVFAGEVITEGFPRVDRQVNVDPARVRERLARAGLRLDPGAKTVLYAPTWRGESFHAPTNDAELLGERVREVRRHLPDGYQVLLKVHQQVYGFAMEHPELSGLLVPNDVPTNEVLGVTDVLVTDYSSVFFDFLASGRPIIFYAPDRNHYGAERGLYLPDSELPGPVTGDIPRLAALIRASNTGEEEDPAKTHRAVYQRAQDRFVPKDDGRATERVIDIVFRGRSERYDVKPLPRDGRMRLLIYLGGLRSNGITASALNLMSNIDYDRFDVSAFYGYSAGPDAKVNERSIPEEVRLFPRVGGITPSKLVQRQRDKLQTVGIDAPGLKLPAMREIFRDEWRRCFGDTEFDYIVDFSGYAPFWSFLLRQGPAQAYSIWLHSDLKSDQLREVGGHRPHEANLRAVFSTYAEYDHMVSVSPKLCELNSSSIGRAGLRERFTFARNTINFRRIRRMAYGPRPAGPEGQGEEVLSIPASNLPDAVATLAERHPLPAILQEVLRQQTINEIVPPAPGVKTFVAVGRLSPEKNYGRLIRAFSVVHQENPDTRLVIIGGGPLLGELEALAAGLGVANSVRLAGQQPNPYAVMGRSDCLVLSSDYEGQPMVFLEALTLGLPIVTTNFDSVEGSLPKGSGLVVPTSVEGLADGMRAALAGEVPNAPFDPADYNAQAMREFYRAIGVPEERIP